jgi:hypothetical protein
MAQTVTLSSVGTATMALNPVAKSTTLLYTTTASSGVGQVEISLDDPTIPGGPTATWGLVSSAAAMPSTTVGTAGLVYTVLSPVAQVRLNSTAIISGGTHVLKALQSVTA